MWSASNCERKSMNFNEDQLTIQRLSDKITELESELEECRNMEAYYKGQCQPLQDVIDNLKMRNHEKRC